MIADTSPSIDSEPATAAEVGPSLPHPVYFVYADAERWPGLDAASALPNCDEHPDRLETGPQCWTLQTYLRLAALGADVRLVSRTVPGRINVIHKDDQSVRRPSYSSYVVTIQPDRSPHYVCEQTVIQNAASLPFTPRPAVTIPLWPQPGLVPRDTTRPPRVSRLGFFGATTSLAEEYKSDGFRAALAADGVELMLGDWCGYDYTEVDAVMAVRRLPPRLMITKPATKLYNSWLAGVPALLGEEAAFRQLRRSELDYLPVASPADVIRAVQRLNASPDRYGAMVANGRERGRAFTVDEIAFQWLSALSGPIAYGFEKWQRASAARRLSRPARFVTRTIQQKIARESWRRRDLP